MTMTREELKGKQTPGDWIVIASWDDYIITADGLGEDAIIWQDGPHDTPTMTEADATLAAEAGTVANRTGMWPEDLVARVKELEEALDTITQQTERAGWDGMSVHHARAILNKSTP